MQYQPLKHRLIKTGIFISFLLCYLEWPKDQSGFMFQLEYEVFVNSANADTFMHPLIFIPFGGQLLLLISIFLNKQGIVITRISIALLSVLVLIILLAGSLSSNFRMVLSTLPFISCSFFYLMISKKTSTSK